MFPLAVGAVPVVNWSEKPLLTPLRSPRVGVVPAPVPKILVNEPRTPCTSVARALPITSRGCRGELFLTPISPVVVTVSQSAPPPGKVW